MNEIISETKLAGKYRRRGTSVASASSVVNLTDQRPRITDQKRGTSDDLLIDHCSLEIERSACQGMTLDPVTGLYYTRNRNYDPSLGSVLRQEPKSRLSAGVAHREINQYPLQYINGANTYQFVTGNPVNSVDPSGLVTNSLLPPPGGSSAQQQAWLNRLTASAGGLPDGASLLLGNMSSGAPIWTSVDPLSMMGQYLYGGGTPIHIVAPQFVAAQIADPTFKNMLANFDASLRTALRNAAKNLAPGKSVVVPFSAKHQGYNMPEPYWAGFGTVYVNINANITINKDRTGHTTYSGNLDFHGYDVYQWGTSMNSPHWYSRLGGDFANAVGNNFGTYWDWQIPISGSLGGQ